MCTFCNVGKEVDPPTPFDENDFNRFSNDVWIGAVNPQQLPTGIYLKTAKYLKDGIDLAPVVDEVLTADLLNNIYVFSGAKTYQSTRTLTALLSVPEYQSNFYAFKKAAEPFYNTMYQDYLQAEYQTAKASARMASDWKRIEMDADVLPLLQYQTVGDGRVRPTHAALDNIIRPISDPFWKQYYPPNGWRCRCTVIQLSEGQETDLSKFTPPEDVPPLFRMNAGQDGYVFKSKGKDKHPYFDIAKGDKEAAKVNWNLPPLSTTPKPAPIIEVPKVFKPATTIKEAEEFALNIGVTNNVNYSKIPLEYANEINKSLQQLYLKNPVKIDAIGDLKTIKKELKEAFTKSDKNVLAQAMQRGDKFYLGLGETFKEKGFVENYIKRLSEKEVIKNIDFNGVISHEYGHLFDFKNKIDYFTSHSDKLFDIMIKEQNKFISKGYFERPIKEKIGSYLFTNRQEFFAECYRLYDNNIMPNELKFVNDYMKKIFKK